MRRLLLLLLAPLLLAATFAPVRPGVALRFPMDHGAHPDFRTEWWYVTGHARAGDREFGFQVTFEEVEFEDRKRDRETSVFCEVRRGEVIVEDMLTAKRPGTGVSPLLLWDHIGRVAGRDYSVDDAIDP